MNEKIRAVEKTYDGIILQNRSMTIRTVGNVEYGKSFVLIGCGSRKSKRVKSYGHLKKRKKAMDRSLILFDGIGESL